MSAMIDKWAGNYDCSGPCGRKRLIADNFSKSSLNKYKTNGKALRCKKCVEEAQKQEQNIMNSVEVKADVPSDISVEEQPIHICSSCSMSLPSSNFNKNQLNKGEGKQRCKKCVQEAESATAKAIQDDKAAKLAQAEERLRLAEASKNTVEILAASSALAALEAQAVTGMKTVRGGGKGAGRGGGKGRGRGRDRGGGSCWSRR